MILLLLLFASIAQCHPPSCAVLFCGPAAACEESYARIWLAAAQAEAARVYNTVNGGFLAAECTPDNRATRVPPLDEETLHKILCIDPESVPRETCAFKHCDFQSHPELFSDDDGCTPADHAKKSDKDKSACRTLKSWLAIANAKLVTALRDNDASAACVADFIFTHIADFLRTFFDKSTSKLPFLNEFALDKHVYRHQNSLLTNGDDVVLAEPEFSVVVPDIGIVDSVVFNVISVQSYRECWRHETHRHTIEVESADGTVSEMFVREKIKRERLASLLFYSSYNGTNAEQLTQLLMPLGGLLPSFSATINTASAFDEKEKEKEKGKKGKRGKKDGSSDASVFEAYSDDSSDDGSSGDDDSRNDIKSWFDPFEQRPNNKKKPKDASPPAPPVQNMCVLMGAESNLLVYDEERRFAFIESSDYVVVRGDGPTRRYRDLARDSECGTVVLLRNASNEEPQSSFTQLQLSPFTVDETSLIINSTLLADELSEVFFGRVASEVICQDTPGVVVFETLDDDDNNTVTARAAVAAGARKNVPLTLAPGESRCVGGPRRNELCTMPSECGAALACRRRPFDDDPEAAYCYDGVQWFTDEPCAFAGADEECPFGECIGEISGQPGGVFPLLHFAMGCSSGDGGVCKDARVQQWHAFSSL